MPTEYIITMDTHCRTTDVCIKTAHGKLVRREHVTTGIPQLRELITSVPHPRRVAFEEGSMAGWLYRHLHEVADETIVCDPRRNAHIAKDGDKDDAIDAEKLNDLYRGGFLRPVHQLDSAALAGRKQLVGLYHDRVQQRLREGNHLLALGKRWGILWTRGQLEEPGGWPALAKTLSEKDVPVSLHGGLQGLWQSLELALQQEAQLYQAMLQLAATDTTIQRLIDLPGYGPIRAATLVTYLDTPWRFKSKSALWKYVGIGLRRHSSGEGPPYICVEQACNRLLRGVVIGAAQSAIDQQENVFARRYEHWIRAGISPRNARRNVARDLVTTFWGMWKSNQAFDERFLKPPS